MSNLTVLTFDSTYGAQQAVAAVRALTELRYAWVDDLAIVERHHSGRVSTHTSHGSTSGGAWWGALLGMLVGFLWPPAWFLALAGAGAGIGALAGRAMKEAGLDETMAQEVKDELTPGTSALLLMGTGGDTQEMARAFEPYHPVKVLHYEVPEQTVESLKQALADGEQAASDADDSAG